MKLLVALLLLPVWSAAQAPGAATRNTQMSSGNCSPNIVSNGIGPITIQLGGCAADSRAEKRLIDLFEKFFAQFPDARKNQATIDNLNRLLSIDKRELENTKTELANTKTELAEKVQEVEEWTTKYRELSQRLAEQPVDDELSKQAAEALKEGNLSRAEAEIAR